MSSVICCPFRLGFDVLIWYFDGSYYVALQIRQERVAPKEDMALLMVIKKCWNDKLRGFGMCKKIMCSDGQKYT